MKCDYLMLHERRLVAEPHSQFKRVRSISAIAVHCHLIAAWGPESLSEVNRISTIKPRKSVGLYLAASAAGNLCCDVVQQRVVLAKRSSKPHAYLPCLLHKARSACSIELADVVAARAKSEDSALF